MRSNNTGIEGYVARFEHGLETDAPAYFDQEAYHDIVEHYLEVGNNQRAQQACDMALEVHPQSADLLVSCGKLAYLKGDKLTASDYANKGLTLQPYHAEGLLLLTQSSLTEANAGALVALLEQSLAANAEPDVISLALGLAYIKQGQFGRGISQYKAAILSNNRNEQAWHILTETLAKNKRLKPNVAFYQQQVDQDPYNYTAWFYLGQLHNQLNDFGKAAWAFDYCTVIDDQLPEGWFMKGAALLNEESFEAAITCLNHVLALQPTNQEAKVYVAACYEHLKQFDKAVAAYKSIIAEDKTCADAWHGVGSCMMAQDRNFEAIHWFNRALQLDRTKGMYWYGLAQAEYRMGNIISSQEAYEEACNCDPDNHEIYLDWSFVYYDCGDFERAISLITSGIEECPEESSLYYRAVIYLLGQGSYREALVYLEKALLLDFEGHTVLYEFYDELETQKALFKIIDQYRPQKDD